MNRLIWRKVPGCGLPAKLLIVKSPCGKKLFFTANTIEESAKSPNSKKHEKPTSQINLRQR